MADIHPRRSALYMPGSKERALEKGKELAADVIIFDLEDAVSPEMKMAARDQVQQAVLKGGYGHRELVIRINGLGTSWFEDDVKSAISAKPDAILVPKISEAEDVTTIREALKRANAPTDLAIWAMMETPLAMLNAGDIAAIGPHAAHPLTVFVMGTNDLAKETRAALMPGRAPMHAWLSMCVAAARAYDIDILDGVYNDYKNETGFIEECEQGRDFGMDGKTLIHPSQITPCNEIFCPSREDVEWCEKVIEAFSLTENQGKGAITVDGKMVELLHKTMAERTVALATAIKQQTTENAKI